MYKNVFSGISVSFNLFKKSKAFAFFTALLFLTVLAGTRVNAQTPGFIYQPATTVAGKTVLNPSGSGYTSKTNAGFPAPGTAPNYNDFGSYSELNMTPVIEVSSEPVGDVTTGATGGQTDIVGGSQSVYVLNDGTNLIIRFRIGKNSSASKGYSLLIDNNGQFGPSDPNYTTSNLGFEIAVTLETNFGVKVHDLRSGGGTTSYTSGTQEQRSIANSAIGGNTNVFYDFYVPLTALTAIGPITSLRFAATSINSGNSDFPGGTPSDINGITDGSYNGNFTAAFTTAINSFPPTNASVAGFTFAPILSTAPVITTSINTASTTISGTSTEATGTTITVYRKVGAGSYTSVGTTTVQSGGAWSWTVTGITLAANDLIEAKATASGKSESTASNIITVVAGAPAGTPTCYIPPPTLTTIATGNGKPFGGSWTDNSTTQTTGSGLIIQIYTVNTTTGTIDTVNGGAAKSILAFTVSARTTTALSWATTTASWSNLTSDRTKSYMAVAIMNGCRSTPSNMVSGDQATLTAVTAAPMIVNSPQITAGTGPVTVTNGTTASSTLYLYDGNTLIGQSSSTVAANTSATINITGTMIAGDKLTAYALASGNALSVASPIVTVAAFVPPPAVQATAPVITGSYVSGAGKTVSGTSIEAAGSSVVLYNNGTQIGTATVDNFGNWSVTGLTLAANDALTAKVTGPGESISNASNTVTVGNATSVPAPPSINSPIMAGATSISGTGGVGTVTIYEDGAVLGTTTGASWTLSGLSVNDLYKGGSIYATNTNSSLTSANSTAVVVSGIDHFLVEASGGGNIGTQTAGVAFPIQITAETNPTNGTIFTTYTATNYVFSGSFVSAGTGPTTAFSSGILNPWSVTLTTAGTYSITSTTTDLSVTGTSNTFTINPGPAKLLAVKTQPSTTVGNEVYLPQQPAIYVEDQYGNIRTSDNTTQVTASIYSGSGTLNGQLTVTAVNGVATFSRLSISGGASTDVIAFSSSGLTGVNSSSITVTANTPAAPTGLSYNPTNIYNVGTTITSLTPTVTGTVTSYSIDKTLPNGLSFNTATGVISGTPTASSAQTTYTITAHNSTGTASYSITITVTSTLAITVSSHTDATGTNSDGTVNTSTSGGTSPYSYTISGAANTTGATTGNFTGLAANTYTITVTDANSVTATASVTIHTAVSLTVGSKTDETTVNGNNGSVTVVEHDGTGTFTYALDGGTSQGTATFSGLSPGSHTVVVTDGGTGQTASVSFTINHAAPTALAYTTPNAFVVNTAITSLSPTVTGAALSYTVDNLPAGLSIDGGTGVISGTPTAVSTDAVYTVTATNDGGSKSFGIHIAVTNTLTLTVSSHTDATGTNSDGTVSTSTTGGTSPYSYTISGAANTTGATTGNFTGLAANTYTITVTDANSVTATASVTIHTAVSLTVASQTDEATVNGNDGAVTVAEHNGTGATFSYALDGGTGQGSTTFSGLSPGSHTVVVTDGGTGQTASVSFTIKHAAPTALSYTTPNAFVVNTAITSLSPTVTGAALSYTVDNLPAGLSIDATTGVISGTPTAVTTDAVYTVTATNDGGSKSFGIHIAVTNTLTLTVSSHTDATGTNSDGTVNTSTTGGTSPYSYTISGAANTTGATTGNFTGLAANTYTITVTDANSVTATATVTIHTAVSLAVASQTDETTVNGNDGAVTVAEHNGTGATFSYALDGGTGQGSTTFSGLSPGSHTVVVTDGGTGQTASVSFTIKHAAPTALSYTTPNAFVVNTAITSLSPTVTGAALSYTVDNLPAGLSIDGGTGVISGTPTAVSTDAVYTVTATNDGGSKSFGIHIAVTNTLTLTVSSHTDATGTNSDGTVNTSTTGGTSPYSYTISGAANTTGATTGNFTGLAANTYTITVTDANSVTATASVTIHTAVSLTVGSKTDETTVNGNNGSVTVVEHDGTGTFTYALDGGTSQGTATFSGLSPGSHTVVVTDGGTGQTASVSFTINHAAPTALAYTTPNAFVVNTAITSLSPTVTGAALSYTVDNLPAGLSIDGGTGVISGTPTAVSTDAVYTVTATNDGGSKSFGIHIAVTNTLTLTVSSHTDATGTNSDGTVSTSTTGGTSPYSYTISGAANTTGATTGNFTGLAANTYTITVTDANSVTATASVTIHTAVSLTVASQTDEATVNGNDGAVTVAEHNGTGATFSYALDGGTGQGSTTFSGLSPGSHTVVVTDGGTGQTASVSFTIKHAAPTALSYTTPNAFVVNTAITSLSPTVTGAALSYTVDNLPAGLSIDATTGVISGTPTAVTTDAVYTVTATNDGGSKSFGIHIAVTNTLTLTVSSHTDATGTNSDGTVNTSTTGGTSPYSYTISGAANTTGATTGNFTGLAANTYTITVTDANSVTATATVTIHTAVSLTVASQTDETTVNGNDGAVTVAEHNGTGATFSYALDGGTGQGSTTFSGLSPGSHTVVVTDGGTGQTASVSFTIKHAAPTALSYTTPNAFVVNTAITSLSPTVTGAALSYTVDNLPAGLSIDGGTGVISGTPTAVTTDAVYTVTATNDGGSKSFGIHIAVTNTLTLTVSSHTDATGTNSDGTVNTSTTGGTSPYSYTISGAANTTGATTGNFTGLAANTYTITVTDANSVTATASVTIHTAVSLTVGSKTDETTVNGNNGSVTVVEHDGTGTFTYALDGGTSQGTATFSGLSPGSHTVVVTDGGTGQTASVSFTINHAAPTALAYTTPNAFVVNTAITSLSPTVTGAALSYTVDNLPAGLSIDATTGVISGTPTAVTTDAVYTVTATNDGGSKSFGIHIAVTNSAPSALSYTTPNTYDVGTAIADLSPTATGLALTYSAITTLPAGLSINSSTGVISGTPTAAATAQNYTIKAANDGGSITFNINITVNPALTLTVNGHTDVTTTGNNGTVTVTASNGTSPYSYSIVSSSNTTGASNGIFTGLAVGTYTMKVTDAINATTTTTVTINSALGLSVTSYTDATSAGNDGTVTVSSSGGTGPSFTYSIDGGSYVSTTTFTGLATGNHTITVKDGTTNQTASASVTIHSALSLTVNGHTDVTTGNDGTVTVTASNGTSPYTYSIVSSSNTTGSSNGIFTGLAVGTYTMNVTDAHSVTATASVTINAALSLAIASHTDVTTAGNDGTVAVTETGGTGTFTYSIDGTHYQPGTSFSGLAAGTYTITVKDATTGQTATASVTINSAMSLAIASHTDVTTAGNDGTVAVTETGGTGTFTYSIDGTHYQPGTSFSGLAAGPYTITVKDATTGQTATASVTINAALIATISSQTDVIVYGGTTGAVTVAATGGTGAYQYQIGSGTLQNSPTFTGLAADNYVVTVQDANNATSTVNVTIAQPSAALAVAVTSKTDVIAHGASTGAVTVAGTGGTSPYQYQIGSGTLQSSPTFTGLAAGNYVVTVQDVNGVTSTVNVTIAQPSAVLAVAVTSKTDVIAHGASTGAVTVAGTGGTSPYQYQIGSGTLQSSPTFTGLAAGNYVVTVQDVNGVTSTVNVTIAQPSAVLAVAVTSKTDVIAHGASTGAVTVAGTGGTSPYQYQIGSGTLQNSPTFTGLAAGNYVVTVQDVNGVTSTVNVTIAQPSAALAVTITSKTDVIAYGASTGAVTVAGTGGTSPYQYQIGSGTLQNSPTFTGLAAGNYVVTVQDNNGVTSTVNVTIAQPSAALAITITSKTDVIAYGASTGAVTVAGTGGTSPYQYKIGTGSYQSGTTFSGLAAGNYVVTVQDNNGVISTVNVTIAQPSAALAVTIASQTDVIAYGASTGAVTVAGTGGTSPYQYKIGTGALQNSPTFTGLAAGNYVVTVQDNNGVTSTVNVTIAQPSAALTVAVTSQTNVSTYGGTGSVTLASTGGTGPYQYKIGNGSYQSSGTFNGLTAGVYVVTVKDANGVTSTITVTMTQPPAIAFVLPSKTYGDADFPIGATSTNTGAPITYVSDNTSVATIVNGNVHIFGAGTANITASQAGDSNNIARSVTQQLTINQATLTVTADDKTRIYGNNNPSLTVTYTGFVNGENAGKLTAQATANTSATASTAPGNYTITASGAAAANYQFNYISGVLKITPLSNNNASNIAISKGTLSPAFSSGTLNYTASVGYDIDYITVTPSFDATASSTVNGMPVTNGNASGNIYLSAGNNVIQVVITAQDGTTKTYQITVYKALAPTAIVPTNFLSPNGDGKNDAWVVKDIELYPLNKVTIFDRAGRPIYSKVGYTNDWDGTLNGTMLTQGTYYYLIELAPGMAPIKGFITIIKSK